jgi:large subunit ribosomal protein L31
LDKKVSRPTFADLINYSIISTAKSVLPLNQGIMKKGLHPDSYRLVVFKDMSNGHTFLSRSTANTKETLKWEDGNEYPLVKLEISNTSHPFFTGKNMLVDTAGRIDKFKKKYAKKAE